MREEHRKYAPFGVRLYLLASVAAAVFCPIGAAHAQSASADRAAARDDDREIVVVGTHLSRGQAIGPIANITADDIDRSGALTLREVLATLPQNAGGGYNEASSQIIVNVGSNGLAGTWGTSANLRGLGPKSTLTLVNGLP